MQLNGSIAIVTGGSGGIGGATAAYLVEKGCKVAAWDINVDNAPAASDALIYSACDITDSASITAVLRLVAAEMAKGEPDSETGERGVIINTGSIAGYEGQIGQAAYAASKGGVASMTLPIARELARSGIRVMTIAPGAVETPMMDKVPQEYQDAITANIPFPSRFAKSEEFAMLAAHIVENPMLNGEVIRLDGAARLPAK